MSKLPTPTRHAAERYQERVDPTASLGLAWRAIERNMTRAVKIPLRYAKERWTTRDAPIPKRVNMDWWLSAEMLTVVVSGRIVTLWEVTDDDRHRDRARVDHDENLGRRPGGSRWDGLEPRSPRIC
jgi:hypothetical protein